VLKEKLKNEKVTGVLVPPQSADLFKELSTFLRLLLQRYGPSLCNLSEIHQLHLLSQYEYSLMTENFSGNY
jgi:hypothetical protein